MDIRIICRGCLNPEGQTKHILIYSDDAKIANEIFQITNLIIVNFSDNNHPAVLCEQCYLDLQRAVSFRDKMIKNDQIFNKLYGKRTREKLKQYESRIEEEESSSDASPDELVTDIKVEQFEIQSVQVDEAKIDEISPKTDKTDKTSPTKNTVCKYCGKKFTKKLYLKQHFKTVHMNKKHRCKNCGKKFATEDDLNEHTLKHVGDKPFKCHFPLCSKSFNYKADLTRHEVNHSNDMPFKCNNCNKGFARNDHLLKHLETHEKKREKLKKNLNRRNHLKISKHAEVLMIKQ